MSLLAKSLALQASAMLSEITLQDNSSELNSRQREINQDETSSSLHDAKFKALLIEVIGLILEGSQKALIKNNRLEIGQGGDGEDYSSCYCEQNSASKSVGTLIKCAGC